MRSSFFACAAAALVSLCASVASAQVGTAITYQGRIDSSGTPVTGTIDVQFTAFDKSTGGSELVPPVNVLGVSATGGLFTAVVDFGAAPFTTSAGVWVQVAVRVPAGAGSFVPVGPRQFLTPTPFSLATRGFNVAANNDVSLISAFAQTRVFGLPQGELLGTGLTIQAGGTTAPSGIGQSGGQLLLRAGNANLSAASAPATGTSGGNDVVLQAGENTYAFSFGDRFSGNIRFIAGDSGIGVTGSQPERMRILGDNGFVGINTTSPATRLDVNGALRVASVIQRSTTPVTATADLGLYTDGSLMRFVTNGGGIRFFTNYANGTAASPTTAQFSVESDGTIRVGSTMTIGSTGNSSPDGSLIARRAATGNIAGLLSGYGGTPSTGFQIAVVNSAGTAIIGSLFSNYTTNQGTLTASVKNFVEPSPRDPSTDIYYASLEGPEAAMYTRGTATLVNGQAFISLPTHFSDLASSQGLTVLLTPLSADSMGLAVIGKSPSGFQVRELLQGRGNYAFDWEVKAVRKQYLDYRVQRSWTERRAANPRISDAQAWEIRQQEVAAAAARAQAKEAQALESR